jgi:hypothetical protein
MPAAVPSTQASFAAVQGVIAVAKIEVKQVRATMTLGEEMEPHWEAVVSYGPHVADVVIPLPARQLPTDDLAQGYRESIEAMETRARAFLDFASHIRKSDPSLFECEIFDHRNLLSALKEHNANRIARLPSRPMGHWAKRARFSGGGKRTSAIRDSSGRTSSCGRAKRRGAPREKSLMPRIHRNRGNFPRHFKRQFGNEIRKFESSRPTQPVWCAVTKSLNLALAGFGASLRRSRHHRR